MLKYPITESVDYGFDVTELDDVKIEASFYEKQVSKQSFRLPNGELVENDILNIIIFDFVFYMVRDGYYILCLKSPPRSIKTFLDKLEMILETQIYVSNMNINITSFIDGVYNIEDASQISIQEILATDLAFDEKSTGEVKVKSNSNALDVLKNKFECGSYLLKSCKIVFFINGKKVITKVTHSGGIECSNMFEEHLFPILYKTNPSI